eukprot:gnl/MRDRNA2_/MRDRNA2_78078_c0_seq1.p1 gnl/MRDRNA2_/MRDRNA2_78078_c0~~gnl/MRDRNA2_/MRDRNA2_78078_c0_seq1.p1  ORF type:complete len:448 (+),score=68.23 gnl/MRDRNA2_/MRDRNA2_78078_c0_seq1:156-1499(+)
MHSFICLLLLVVAHANELIHDFHLRAMRASDRSVAHANEQIHDFHLRATRTAKAHHFDSEALDDATLAKSHPNQATLSSKPQIHPAVRVGATLTKSRPILSKPLLPVLRSAVRLRHALIPVLRVPQQRALHHFNQLPLVQRKQKGQQRLFVHSANGVRPVVAGHCLVDALPPGEEVQDHWATERLVGLQQRKRDDGQWDIIVSAADGAKPDPQNDIVPLGHFADLRHAIPKTLAPQKLCQLDSQPIRFYVVVVVEDSKGRILLTRRHQRMRTFPGAWVAPGGGVDPGETLSEAGVRELREETGLHVTPSQLELIGLWESAGMPAKDDCQGKKGMQTGHQLVVCYRARLDENADAHLKFSPEEVDAALWLDHQDLQKVMSSSEPPEMLEAFPAAIRSSQIRGVYPNEEGEGIALGHTYILSKLLQQHGLPIALDEGYHSGSDCMVNYA